MFCAGSPNHFGILGTPIKPYCRHWRDYQRSTLLLPHPNAWTISHWQYRARVWGLKHPLSAVRRGPMTLTKKEQHRICKPSYHPAQGQSSQSTVFLTRQWPLISLPAACQWGGVRLSETHPWVLWAHINRWPLAHPRNHYSAPTLAVFEIQDCWQDFRGPQPRSVKGSSTTLPRLSSVAQRPRR